MTATAMTFETVQAIFNRLYETLREVSRENAPSSYTWLARTYLEIEVDREGRIYVQEEDFARVGTGSDFYQPGTEGKPAEVAWVYECNGPSMTVVHEGATEAEVERLLSECMGVDDISLWMS